MKLAEWKFTIYTNRPDLTDEQIDRLMNRLEIIEERITQYINDNLPDIARMETE